MQALILTNGIVKFVGLLLFLVSHKWKAIQLRSPSVWTSSVRRYCSLQGVEHRDVQLIMDKNSRNQMLCRVSKTTQTNEPAGFDAQSTQHPTAAEMPAEISLEEEGGEQKESSKTMFWALEPCWIRLYLGFGSSTWETGEIHIYCAIHLNNS